MGSGHQGQNARPGGDYMQIGGEMFHRADAVNEARICPCCGGTMRQSWGLNGINPNYEHVRIWRCNTGYACDLVGYGLDEAMLTSPAKIAHLAELTRRNSFVKKIRRMTGCSKGERSLSLSDVRVLSQSLHLQR